MRLVLASLVAVLLRDSELTLGAVCSCVNALSWSDDGNILLSGSDDKR